MIYFLKISLQVIFVLGLATAHASPLNDINLLMRTKQMSLYGVKTKDQNMTNGVGLFYNTQKLKFKAEGSETSFKTGAMLHVNPLESPIYLNIGANYLDDTIQAAAIRNNVTQYSSALAIGYMLDNDLNLEIGGNFSRRDGYQISENTAINTQITKDTYLQLAKRFETPIGTIDTHLNSSQIYNTLSTKQENYASNVDYYLNDAIKVGYTYSINQNEICDGYSLTLGYFATQYTKNTTLDSYNMTVGIKANFTDITNFTTYSSPTKVKKRLARSNKFDTMVLHNNMRLRR
jgi:hypothetical protein